MLAIARLELNNFFARCWKSRGKSWKADAENGEQVVESREKPLRDLSPACRGKSWKADAKKRYESRGKPMRLTASPSGKNLLLATTTRKKP